MQSGVSGPTMSGKEWVLLLILAVLWGGSFFFNGVAVRELPSFTIVWLRVASADAALLIVLRLLGRRMPMQGRVWLAFFGMGLLNNVLPFALIVWGQHRIASGLASILNATTPLFTVLVAHLLTPDEKLTPLKGAGVLVGFVGAAVMIGPDALEAPGGGALGELTKNVVESGLLVEEAGRYRLDGPLPPLAIPSTLQDSSTIARLFSAVFGEQKSRAGANTPASARTFRGTASAFGEGCRSG